MISGGRRVSNYIVLEVKWGQNGTILSKVKDNNN